MDLVKPINDAFNEIKKIAKQDKKCLASLSITQHRNGETSWEIFCKRDNNRYYSDYHRVTLRDKGDTVFDKMIEFIDTIPEVDFEPEPITISQFKMNQLRKECAA